MPKGILMTLCLQMHLFCDHFYTLLGSEQVFFTYTPEVIYLITVPIFLQNITSRSKKSLQGYISVVAFIPNHLPLPGFTRHLWKNVTFFRLWWSIHFVYIFKHTVFVILFKDAFIYVPSMYVPWIKCCMIVLNVFGFLYILLSTKSGFVLLRESHSRVESPVTIFWYCCLCMCVCLKPHFSLQNSERTNMT